MTRAPEPETSLVDDFKAAFRRLASGVCVVTFEKEGRLHGFTATSVTSISASPPMLLFCVSNRSSSFSSMTVGLDVGVSILSSGQRPLADRFARRAEEGGYPDVETERLDGGAPALAGALASLSGRITEIVPAGENIVLFCEVGMARHAQGGTPLLYSDGSYLAPQAGSSNPHGYIAFGSMVDFYAQSRSTLKARTRSRRARSRWG